MDEAKYENAMQIILHAGNARSAALMAIDDAAEGDFSAADAHLIEAQNELHDAHERQFSLIQSEVNGAPVDVSVILVHAQDHLSMAIMASDLAERMVEMHRRLARLEAGA